MLLVSSRSVYFPGVILPTSLEEAKASIEEIMVTRVFGEAGDEVIIEELLEGPEASFLVFTDGTDFVSMPPAQDHKRIGDGDKGPNTGGMGVFAPTPNVTKEIMVWHVFYADLANNSLERSTRENNRTHY